MRSILITTPTGPTGRSGNDVTASRWARHLTGRGHTVTVAPIEARPTTGPNTDRWHTAIGQADILVALHARRSAAAVAAWIERRPGRPVVVALTGTDLYLDMPDSAAAMASAAAADRFIVLQRAAIERLRSVDPDLADRAAVVHQSIDPVVVPARRPTPGRFRVVVLAHLREVKDPLLAARAARLLPDGSTVVIDHAGRALDKTWADAAEAETETNPRYRWHRELEGRAALELLATGDVLACTSVAEGGANAVTEALAVGVPVIGTRIDGNTGLLGDDHPGLFPVGDEAAFAELLHRLESDRSALSVLQQRTDARRALTDPAAERRALAAVIDSL